MENHDRRCLFQTGHLRRRSKTVNDVSEGRPRSFSDRASFRSHGKTVNDVSEGRPRSFSVRASIRAHCKTVLSTICLNESADHFLFEQALMHTVKLSRTCLKKSSSLFSAVTGKFLTVRN